MSKPKVSKSKTKIKLRSGYTPEPKPASEVTLLAWNNEKIVVRYLDCTQDELDKQLCKVMKYLYPDVRSAYDCGEWQILDGHVPIKTTEVAK